MDAIAIAETTNVSAFSPNAVCASDTARIAAPRTGPSTMQTGPTIERTALAPARSSDGTSRATLAAVHAG